MTEKKAGNKLIVIGASIGGPGILLQITKKLPADTPPIVVVQHICEGFSKQMSEWMDQQCNMHVKEAEDGEIICNGTIYIAKFGKHLVVKKLGACYMLHYETGKREHGVCPSIDQLFGSATCAGKDAMGILLSGMGKDGANGMLAMQKQGAYTIGQDSHTSVIYGIAKEAQLLGAVTEELPAEQITERIMQFANKEE